jgi:hypothetical protein
MIDLEEALAYYRSVLPSVSTGSRMDVLTRSKSIGMGAAGDGQELLSAWAALERVKNRVFVQRLPANTLSLSFLAIRRFTADRIGISSESICCRYTANGHQQAGPAWRAPRLQQVGKQVFEAADVWNGN